MLTAALRDSRHFFAEETGASFEGQRVAVLGNGNAAFETANAIAPYAAHVHILQGRKKTSLDDNERR